MRIAHEQVLGSTPMTGVTASDPDPRRTDFDVGGFAADPLDQFRVWMADAIGAGAKEPNAMALATVGADGMPDVRMVLLNAIDDRGFTFFTNVESAKAEQLGQTPHAALTFWWYETWRQVRVRGGVERLDDTTAAAYFATRPREAQVGAWASRQSRSLVSREALEEQVQRVGERFAGVEVPKPPHWGGYRVVAAEVEFWQGRSGRLHDRLLYRSERGSWMRSRLQP
ncbi:MAG TPA: pyridoxamine 5'-phosphate oxidase [Candidatus Dormibacteraeota bacterium]|jgi:pyridoxamine 5'-phosphate oxidase